MQEATDSGLGGVVVEGGYGSGGGRDNGRRVWKRRAREYWKHSKWWTQAPSFAQLGSREPALSLWKGGCPYMDHSSATLAQVSSTFTMRLSLPSRAQQRSTSGSSWAARRDSSDFQ